MATKEITADSIYKEYDSGKGFNSQVNLESTVETNENFYIGKQWEGVTSNGLPTPTFNFLKRIVMFQCASILSDNIKMQASPLSVYPDQNKMAQYAEIISNEFESLFERNTIGDLLREFLRNAAVDGDGCLYTYWNPDAISGEKNAAGTLVKGAIETEIIDNTRVFFGNPNERRINRQPYIIIESREMLDSVRERAEENGVKKSDLSSIQTDAAGNSGSTVANMTDNRVTVLLRLWKDKKTGTIWACESVKDMIIKEPWDLKIRLYPIVWLNWDYIQNCYHGQSMITGLIPNQIFINKTFAMVMLSLMQSAFPKIVYDKTRISAWTNQVGVAVGVNGGGDMNNIAKVIEPAQISPQISQFIESVITYTQTFCGATDAALGDTRPDNTSAIIALQRASSAPLDLTKQNLYTCVESLGNIYLEFMIANYGKRMINQPEPDSEEMMDAPVPIDPNASILTPQQAHAKIKPTQEFDYSDLKDSPMLLKLDVGASSYWSEVAAMQTLDNLLMQGKIDIIQYLERVPSGYIPEKQQLIEEIKKQSQVQTPPQTLPTGGNPQQMPTQQAPIPLTAGNSNLQRAITQGNKAV